MCEQVFAAAVWSDEAKTLGVVKPFYCTGCHSASFNIAILLVNRRMFSTQGDRGIHASAIGSSASITCHLVTMVANSVRSVAKMHTHTGLFHYSLAFRPN
jgi:hypothetical protein